MKIRWFGHSAFLIQSAKGLRIVTDPYKSGSYSGDFAYGPIAEPADIVTVSHVHADHFDPENLPQGAVVVKSPGKQEIKGIAIEGITTCHDETGGRERGLNTVFCFTVDGMRVCHLGDLGHELSVKERNAIGPTDVLLVPVGGHFTIDAEQAAKVATALESRVIIPMHYRTPALRAPGFPISGVEDFIKAVGSTPVRRQDKAEIEVTKETLPKATEVWILQHAR